MSRNTRKRALSPGPRIEIKKPSLKKRKGVYFVGNFEFNSENVNFKKSSVRRKLTSDIKTRLDNLQSLEWGTKKRLNEALRREIEKSHRDSSTGEAFEWEYNVPNSDKMLKCEGRPAKYDAKTSLVLLKIKNGEATAFPVAKTIDFKRMIEVAEDMEDAEEVEMKQKEDEKNLMKSEKGQLLRRLEEKISGESVAKNARDEVSVSIKKLRGLKTTADEKDMKGYDKRHLKNQTRGMRDDVGDFEQPFSDDEDQPQLEDDDVLNRKEEDDGSSEEESSKDEDYKKLQGLIKDSEEGVDPMLRRKKRKSNVDDEESSDDSDMFARAQLSDVSSSDDEPEPSTGRDKLSSKREARKRARETREVVKRQAEAKKLAASLKQSTGLTKQGVSKILQRHPKGLETKDLFKLILVQCNEDKKDLSKKLKPILKAVGKKKKVEGKTLWFLKPKKREMTLITVVV